MIIKDNTKQVVAIYEPITSTRRKTILAIYHGAQLFWQAISSCFGRGFWINSRQWSNEDAWKNNT